jgi:hypothetical protein
MVQISMANSITPPLETPQREFEHYIVALDAQLDSAWKSVWGIQDFTERMCPGSIAPPVAQETVQPVGVLDTLVSKLNRLVDLNVRLEAINTRLNKLA